MKQFMLMGSLAMVATLALQLMPIQSAEARDHYRFRNGNGCYGRDFGYRDYRNGRRIGYRNFYRGGRWGHDNGRHLGYRQQVRRWF